jgi:predicted signal transduction protein with EAL and GGDEF domain
MRAVVRIVVACTPVSLAGGKPSGELLRCADVAMYEAKRTQSGVAIYRAEADPHSRERLALIDALRDALSSGAPYPSLPAHIGNADRHH